MRNCRFENFGGEIYYTSGTGIGHQQLENVTLNGSPQSALNAGNSGGTFTGINVVAGNSYQPAEVLGGLGFTLIGGRLHDGYSLYITGGPTGFQPGYRYDYPFRLANSQPPWVRIVGTAIDNCSAGFGSFVQFIDPVFTDASCFLANGNQKTSDVIGRLYSVADQSSNFDALYIQGPLNLVTQAVGCPEGVLVVPPSNIKLDIVCSRTALGAANSRFVGSGVNFASGFVDPACQFTVSGEAQYAFRYQTAPVAGWVQPLVVVGPDFQQVPQGQKFGGAYDYLDSDKTYAVRWAAIVLNNSGTAQRTVQLDTTTGFSHGQKVRFYKQEAAGNAIRFPAAGSGLALDRDYTLTERGDCIDLQFDSVIGKWVLERYITSRIGTLMASKSWDPPSIAAGTSASTTITVSGAVPGDFAQAALNVGTAGLAISASVTATDTVTVVLANATGAVADPAAATLSVRVSKA